MKLGVSSAASSMAKEPKQYRKRERPSQESLDMRAMQEALVTVTKLSLSAKQDTRKLMAVSMATFVVPKDSEIIVLGKKAVDEFQERAKEYQGSVEARQTVLGMPSVWIFNAWLTHIQLKLQGGEITGMANQQQALAEITKYIEQINLMPDEERMISLCKNVPHIMIIVPFDKKTRRVEMALNSEISTVNQIIMAYVKTLKGFRMLLGAAPRTALERKAQEFLDSVKEEDED